MFDALFDVLLVTSVWEAASAREAAESGLASAESREGQALRRNRQLEGQLEKATLTCQALWSLISEKTGLSDGEIKSQVESRLPSVAEAEAKTTRRCVSCRRPVHPKLARCMYCGGPVAGQTGS